MIRRLMVLVSDEISAWVSKGEVVDRYYNPGDVFDRVDLVLTNHDRPPQDALQRMAGRAELFVHNVPTPPAFVRRSLGYQPVLVRRWARQVVRLAEQVQPAVLRCHGNDLNAVAAAEVRRAVGIPFLVSLHTVPGAVPDAGSPKERLRRAAFARLGRAALRDADLVLPVYEPIVPYLKRLGVTRYEVAYNTLGTGQLQRKHNYDLHDPIRIVSVGRQVPAKSPANIIRAIADLPATRLTLIGDGPLHEDLRSLAAASDAADRVVFEQNVPNDELCRRLTGEDLFVARSEHPEMSKAALEALLAGLPTVHNRRDLDPVPELEDGIVCLVQDSPQGYREALRALIDDDAGREALGRRGAERAWSRWSPAATEQHFVEIYRRFVPSEP